MAKPKNFPARKLARQMKAEGRVPDEQSLAIARAIRTKKDRSTGSRLRAA